MNSDSIGLFQQQMLLQVSLIVFLINGFKPETPVV
ncbi:unnamed protein product [Brassica rapa subsp. trilocularis]